MSSGSVAAGTFERVLVVGIVLVCAVEFAVWMWNPGWLLLTAGVMTGVVVAQLHSLMAMRAATPDTPSETRVDEMFEQWRLRTAALIERADTTRGEWDRHVRPVLAREYQMAIGANASMNRDAVAVSGRTHFGELWTWVDPSDTAVFDRTTPGPGLTTFDAILTRLEQL